MQFIAHGIDLVDIARTKILMEFSEDFVQGCFLESERVPEGELPTPFYASRYAAKEAIAKALGTGFSQGVTWRQIEVLRDESGVPMVRLHGAAGERAEQLGISRWMVSLSHTGTHAMASAIGLGAFLEH